MFRQKAQRQVVGGSDYSEQHQNPAGLPPGQYEEAHEKSQEKAYELLSVGDEKARTPEYYDAQISASFFWSVNRKGRKHVYIWSPITITLSFEDYGSGPVTAQIWNNVGIPDGTRCYAPSVTGTSTYLKVCATDELIP